MRLPSTIQYGSDKLTLELVSTLDNTGYEGEVWGRYDMREQSVKVLSELNETQQKQTMIHELIHVILFKTGVSESFCQRPDLHESICTSVANGILDLLHQNPGLKVLFK